MNKIAPKISTVVAGLGRAGWDIHWRQLLKGHPAYRVVGAIEPVAERRAEAEAEIGCRTYASFDAFLADPVGELIVIATPSGGHGLETLACLERGLHVAVDKPMCQSVAEADAMIAMARERSRVLTCFHPYRFDPTFLSVRAAVQSGRLGRIVEIKCPRTGFFRRNDWVMRKAKGGGMHNVWGAHAVDQCLQLAASPVRDIFSDLQRTVTPGDADDHAKIILRCQNGVLIDVEVSNCIVMPQPEWLIAGTCGGLVTGPEGVRLKWFDPKAAPPIALQNGPAAGRRYDNDDALPWQEETLPLTPGRGWVEFYDNLMDAIREGASVAITPESVRNTIAVLETCRRQNPAIWEGL
jgi:scyllo-inositol 2-dehydrogenase (NADP+)